MKSSAVSVVIEPDRMNGMKVIVATIAFGSRWRYMIVAFETPSARAARALGAAEPAIMFRHVLPNAMVATLTFLPFILSGSITTLTALDFIGFGLPPGSASLGELLGQGKANLQAPWLALTGFFTIAVMLSLLVFVGEAVRDAFDPRKRSVY